MCHFPPNCLTSWVSPTRRGAWQCTRVWGRGSQKAPPTFPGCVRGVESIRPAGQELKEAAERLWILINIWRQNLFFKTPWYNVLLSWLLLLLLSSLLLLYYVFVDIIGIIIIVVINNFHKITFIYYEAYEELFLQCTKFKISYLLLLLCQRNHNAFNYFF